MLPPSIIRMLKLFGAAKQFYTPAHRPIGALKSNRDRVIGRPALAHAWRWGGNQRSYSLLSWSHMFEINLDIADQHTHVVVQPAVLSETGSLLRAALGSVRAPLALLVSDRNVGPMYSAAVTESLKSAGFRTNEHRIEPGEPSKCLTTMNEIYCALLDSGAGRDAVVVALGGGIVSDVAGFAAATWMRGIRFAICPTTLEADVDASIGGKTGINIPGGKNLAGAFHQPVLVAMDPLCLRTLDRRDIRAGLAESVKHALIASPEFLDWHEQHLDAVLALESSTTTELILRNVRIKADIVQRDAHERSGERMVLNLGHTIGHAIEECSGYALRHGECVALGTLAASRLSNALGLLAAADVDRVERLFQRIGLPTVLEKAIDTDRIVETIRRDKKALGGTVRYVLLEEVGRPLLRDDVPPQNVRNAYESILT